MLSCGNVANDLRDGVIQVHSIAELYENTEVIIVKCPISYLILWFVWFQVTIFFILYLEDW